MASFSNGIEKPKRPGWPCTFLVPFAVEPFLAQLGGRIAHGMVRMGHGCCAAFMESSNIKSTLRDAGLSTSEHDREGLLWQMRPWPGSGHFDSCTQLAQHCEDSLQTALPCRDIWGGGMTWIGEKNHPGELASCRCILHNNRSCTRPLPGRFHAHPKQCAAQLDFRGQAGLREARVVIPCP